MQENFKEIPLIVDLAFKHGASEIQVVQMCSTGRGKYTHPLSIDQLKQLKHILERKKKDYATKFRVGATPGLLEDECPLWHINPENHITMLGCQAGRSSFNIGADGLIMPCLLERKTVGNLREHSLRYIWEETSGFNEERTVKESCLSCNYQNTCSRECPIEPAPEWVKKSYSMTS